MSPRISALLVTPGEQDNYLRARTPGIRSEASGSKTVIGSITLPKWQELAAT